MISHYGVAAKLMYQQVSGLLEVFTLLRRSLGDVPASAPQFHQAQALLRATDRVVRKMAAETENRCSGSLQVPISGGTTLVTVKGKVS